jgi:hypothetical protein
MNYVEVQVKQGRPMGMDELFNMPQSVDLFGIVLGVLIRQHDETLMVIDSAKSAKVESGFVAGIKRREADEQGIKWRTQANISAVLTSLEAQGLSQVYQMLIGQRRLGWGRAWRGGSYRGSRQGEWRRLCIDRSTSLD